MSGFRSHYWAGIFAFFVLLVAMALIPLRIGHPEIKDAFWDWRKLPLLLCISILAAIWPDVDISSRGQCIFYRIFVVLDVALILMRKYIWASILGLSAMLPIIGKHRGWTHTIWSAFLLPSPIILLPMYFSQSYSLVGLPYYLAALAGYTSHLVVDRKLL